MLTRRTWNAVLVAVISVAGRATAQTPAPPDIRVLSLRSLQAGRTVRVSARDIGTITGPVAGVRDGALWLDSPATGRRIPVAAIDSVWVNRGHATTGALVGVLIGTVAGIAAMSGPRCTWGDTGCIQRASLGGTGILLGSTLIGALIGSGMKTWKLRYP